MTAEEEAAEASVRAREEEERKLQETEKQKELGAQEKEKTSGEAKAVVPVQGQSEEMPKLVGASTQVVRRRKPRRVKGPILLYVLHPLLSPSSPHSA